MTLLANLRSSVAARLALTGVVIIVLAVAASVLLSIRVADSAMRERAQSSLTVGINLLRDILEAKGEPRLDNGKLYFGSEAINGNFAAVDKVKALAGSTATVFMGDLRVATNVQKPDGERAVGTTLAAGPAHDAVFKDRARYSGTADILGTPYFTIYEPIVQKSDGKVIGVLYVGIRQADFLGVIDSMISRNLLAGLVIAAMGGGVLLLLMRRMLRPLVSLRDATHRLAAGDLDTPLPAFRANDEIGQMAQAVLVLRDASRDRLRLEAAAARQSAQLDEERCSAEAERAENGRQQAERARELGTLVQLLAHGLSELSSGDFSSRLDGAVPAEYRQLVADFNQTAERLSATIHTIQATAQDVGLAAREINMGADDLSKRTEEQASSLEETAATTEELAASVKASAQASRDAAAIARDAMQAAESGGKIADQAVSAMARIEQASQKISDIIRVIDDIAFQTNLLALNAAVEAARAGDAGKGFAVVASEVRTLAQRSSEAAKDISALISSSNGEVQDGVALVRQAGASLTQILDASRKVAATIADISTATGEQANGIEEMSQAVAHLDGMTQQNAALAEESAASAAALSQRIGQLNELVAAFKTQRGGVSALPASEPERLRDLVEARLSAPRRPSPAQLREPVRKVANGRGDTGWEEF